jgi:RNA polymerase sigma-70 factor (ECF subfamily)
MDGKDFEVFVREHQRMVHAIAWQYVRDDSAADDVAQEAFIRAFRGLEGLREKGHVKTWLYSLTRNAAIDWLRAHKRRHLSIDDAGVDVEEVKDKAASEGTEDMDALMKAVRSLRTDYREIILMRYIEKLSYSQIAEALGMTIGAVGEKLHRVREMIVQKCGL